MQGAGEGCIYLGSIGGFNVFPSHRLTKQDELTGSTFILQHINKNISVPTQLFCGSAIHDLLPPEGLNAVQLLDF